MRLNPFRHQLASTSPVRVLDVWHAVRDARAEPHPEVRRRLADELVRRHRVAEAHLTGSGTEALVLALQVARRILVQEPTVLVPAFSCFDVAAAAVRFGRPVAFYDLDPGTLGPDLDSLAAALRDTPAPHVVVVQTLFGVPVDWRQIDPVLAAADALLIEDAAQGHGARWGDARLGGHGRLGVVSFGRGKGWTGGAGGALLVRDPADAGLMRDAALREGPSVLPWMVKTLAHAALGRPSLYGLPRSIPGLGLGETVYRDVDEPSAMSAHAAALALRSMHAADAWGVSRRRAAERYADLLEHRSLGSGVTPPAGGDPGFIRYPMLLPNGLGSFESPAEAVRLGAASSYPVPLPELVHLRPLLVADPSPSDCPGARTLVRELVTLPTHAWVRAADQSRLLALLER